MSPIDRTVRERERRAAARRSSGLLAAGCQRDAPSNLGQARCDDSYAQGVGPVLQSRCASCHSAALAEGDYRVDSYQAAIARRPDGTPRVRAGDDELAVAPGRARDAARRPRGDRPRPSSPSSRPGWSSARSSPSPTPCTSTAGWIPGNTDQFHGRVLRQAVYNLTGCQACHGEDLTGGTAQRRLPELPPLRRDGVQHLPRERGERGSAPEPGLPLRHLAGDGGRAPVTRHGRCRCTRPSPARCATRRPPSRRTRATTRWEASS